MRGLLALLLVTVAVVQAAGGLDAPAQPHLLPYAAPPAPRALLSPTALTKRQVAGGNSTNENASSQPSAPTPPVGTPVKPDQPASPDPGNPPPNASPKSASPEPQPAPSPTPAKPGDSPIPTLTDTRGKPTNSTTKATPSPSATPTPTPAKTDPADNSSKPAPINGTVLGIVLGSLAGFIGLSTLLYRWKASLQRRQRKPASAAVEPKLSPQFKLMDQDEKAESVLRESMAGQDSGAPLLTPGLTPGMGSPLVFSPGPPGAYSANGDLPGRNSRLLGPGVPPSLHATNYMDQNQNMAVTLAPDYAGGYATPDYASGYTASTPPLGPYHPSTPPLGPYPAGRSNEYQGRASMHSINRLPQMSPDPRFVNFDPRQSQQQFPAVVAYGGPIPPMPMQAAYGASPRVGPYRMQGDLPPMGNPYAMQPVGRMNPSFAGSFPGAQDPQYSRDRPGRHSE